MLKLVIDTNVIISALLKPESNPALIMSLILRGDCLHRALLDTTIAVEAEMTAIEDALGLKRQVAILER